MDDQFLCEQNPEDYFKTPEEREVADAAIEAEAEASRAILTCYHRLFSTDDGQKVLADLSQHLGEHDSLFYPGSQDITNHAIGARSAILYIRKLIAKAIEWNE